ncbi:hypothetical protein, partial [Pseudomonas aeruginosa]|uniref:hypothetical protein n=1 Tax=Pseudomonas aeruginosa TaxID=287 RepID=UPI003014B6D1
ALLADGVKAEDLYKVLATPEALREHVSLDNLHKCFLVDVPYALVELFLNVFLEVLSFKVTDTTEASLVLNGPTDCACYSLNGCI